MFPCEGIGRRHFREEACFSPPCLPAVAPERVTLNGNMFGEILELDVEVSDEFGGVVLSVLELSPLQMSRLSDFYIPIHLF